MDIIKRALAENASIKVSGVIPRMKEGGAFVKFSHSDAISTTDVESTLQTYLREKTIRPWWNPFDRTRTHLVRGRPWVEDLYRPPSSRLRIEFFPTEGGTEAAELSQEQLYSMFRPYGKLAEITSQPSDSKVLPKYALLDFASKKAAIMAKNCLHGFKVHDEIGGSALTRLRASYEQKQKTRWLRDWIFNHPRISIPLLAVLAGAFTVAVFDPIRTFFIKTDITRAFHVTDNKIYKWFVSRTKDFLTLHRRPEGEAGMKAIWDDRKDNIEQIRKWLLETTDTFIVVQGPRGSGKRDLVVGEALKYYRHKLVFDCKPVQEARGDSATIDAAALEVGYRPVFSWMNTISGFIDLAAQGATGLKTGFSETLDAQLAKILNSTASALREVGLESRRKDDKDFNLGADEYLEAHPEKRPVVIIDNFLHKSQENNLVYDKLAEWAARVTTANIAHVIFLTTEVSFSKSLSKALPGRVFRHLSLGDCTPEVAKKFVTSHLDADRVGVDLEGNQVALTPLQKRQDLEQLDECVNYLGGRLSDLEVLARRIQAGETPNKAVKEIISQNAAEILKMYILNDGEPQRKWTPQQAWLLVKELAKSEALRYNEIVLSDLFKTGNADTVLQALEQAELISIASPNGRPRSIKPGKPVYLSAFRLLTEDHVLSSRLDVAILKERLDSENASIAKNEDELRMLAKLPKQPPELTSRVSWLLAKLQASQAKIEKYEAEVETLKKVLQTEF